MVTTSLSISGGLALIAGILILIFPKLLPRIIAFWLIIHGAISFLL